MQKVNVKETTISVMKHNETDYISITDIAKFKSDEPNTLQETGLETEIQQNILVFEKLYIIQILTPSNSRGLERKPDLMLLQYLLQNGLSIRMQKDLL